MSLSNLPAELRNMIWHMALPDEPTHALLPWKPGGWITKDPEDDWHDFDFVFEYERLGPIQFEMSLPFINRESRSISLAWMNKHGFSFQPQQYGHAMGRRAFNPELDALYISRMHWHAFNAEHANQVNQALDHSPPEVEGIRYGTTSHHHRMALSQCVAEEKIQELHDFAYGFDGDIDLLVLLDQPGQPQVEYASQKRFSWGFSPGEDLLFCSSSDGRSFDVKYKGPERRDEVGSEVGISNLVALAKASKVPQGISCRNDLSVRPAIAFQKW